MSFVFSVNVGNNEWTRRVVIEWKWLAPYVSHILFKFTLTLSKGRYQHDKIMFRNNIEEHNSIIEHNKLPTCILQRLSKIKGKKFDS